MGRVILGILAAAVLVVVLDEVLEDGRKEVELPSKDTLEAEFHKLIYQRLQKSSRLRCRQ